MSGATARAAAPDIFLTGFDDARDVVLALPRLSALRAQCPQARITVCAPLETRDLLQRLRLADAVVPDAARSAVARWAQNMWRRLRGGMRVLSVARLEAAAPVDWQRLMRDVSFAAPAPPYVLLALPEGLPVLRAAAVLRKLQMQGYHTAVIGVHASAALDRLCKAVPDAHDLVGFFDLADAVPLALAAVAVIGGCDPMTTLAALAGARTLVLTQGEDEALSALPAATTRWLQSDDLSYVGVNDILTAVQA